MNALIIFKSIFLFLLFFTLLDGSVLDIEGKPENNLEAQSKNIPLETRSRSFFTYSFEVEEELKDHNFDFETPLFNKVINSSITKIGKLLPLLNFRNKISSININSILPRSPPLKA